MGLWHAGGSQREGGGGGGYRHLIKLCMHRHRVSARLVDLDHDAALCSMGRIKCEMLK